MNDEEGGFETEEEEEEESLGVVHPVSFSKLPGYLFANYREFGEEATWTLSSAKAGNGAEALRNGDTQTYWQSDGMHPHKLTVLFHRRVAIMELALNCNHKLDESYTPKRVRVLAGNVGTQDLELVVEAELEPSGWVLIPLFHPKTRTPLRTFVLQVEIVAMMQNGRDTHVRGVRVFGPRSDSHSPATVPSANAIINKPSAFHTAPTALLDDLTMLH
ncbi:hypothetical protein BASA81_000349 [Batrachochytrium salamandrivorans]|nr:hypothetical protein BASA81_000349 [Batrachochytrium salamandrivorans]